MIGRAVLTALCLGLAAPAFAQVVLSEDEIAATLRHGPWPPGVKPDPSNRVSGDPAAIALGAALFSSPLLSDDEVLSCAACHNPATAFADGAARATGRALLDRNTLSLQNLAFHRWFGWDGANDNLWAQSIVPILNPDEFAMPPERMKMVARHPEFAETYRALFGDVGLQSDTEVLVNIAKALAAYQETLISGLTPFDRFRDALETGDLDAAAQYPEDAQRGLQIFLGRGKCSFCHVGPLFTNGEFHDAAVPYFLSDTRVDSGRHGGIEALQSSPYTLDGAYSDDPERLGAWAVRRLRPQHSDFGIFRVPGLRNVARTAPYMHDGSLPDLTAVLRHYSEIDLERLHADGEAILAPLHLNDTEISDLLAFLESLSDG